MAETIATRVGRLISGSVNALIDAVENAAPETVMQQAIREIDAAIDEVRAELGKVLAGKHLAAKRIADENRRHEELTEQIELALKQGREDLAETAVARQFDIEAQLPVLEHTITDAGAQQKELEGYIAALQARRREMEAELSSYKAAQRAKPTSMPAGAASGGDVSRRAERAEHAFQRVLQNATGVPGTPGANLGDAAKLAELEELARKNRIRERLEAMKAKQPG